MSGRSRAGVLELPRRPTGCRQAIGEDGNEDAATQSRLGAESFCEWINGGLLKRQSRSVGLIQEQDRTTSGQQLGEGNGDERAKRTDATQIKQVSRCDSTSPYQFPGIAQLNSPLCEQRGNMQGVVCNARLLAVDATGGR